MRHDLHGFLVPVYKVVIKMPADDVIDADVMKLGVQAADVAGKGRDQLALGGSSQLAGTGQKSNHQQRN